MLLDRWFTDEFRRRNPDIIAARKAQVLDLEPRVYRETYNVYATADFGLLLSKIKVPALVMTGEFADCLPNPTSASIRRSCLPLATTSLPHSGR